MADLYPIRKAGAHREDIEPREPLLNHWYAGIDSVGQIGLVVKWDGYKFTNCLDTNGGFDMSRYQLLQESP